MNLNTTSFKAYDIRGRVPDELNGEIAYAIARAYSSFISPGRVVVGHDIRLSSPEITAALVDGLCDSGVEVTQVGTCGTEEIYFATQHYGFDGGIVVTASHNPKDYNGMKMVKAESRPISADSGLNDIRDLVAQNRFAPVGNRGQCLTLDHRAAYLEHLLSYVDIDAMKSFKVVANPGNGAAGPVMEALAAKLPIELVPLQFEPDGHFPNGVPNPLLPENREPTVTAINQSGADIGIAWDGDFDRCFLFDADGRFIEGYYIVGLLAQAFLDRVPGSAIVHDPRLTWNTLDVIEAGAGRAVLSKAGHAFIKEKMREEDAIYGGEMSAHHYFRDFAYCDSGMIPWLLVLDLMSRRDMSLSELVDERMSMYPVSGEINRRVEDAGSLLHRIEQTYGGNAEAIDKTDGISICFRDWRFNIRSSNTEPVVRLNVESRADAALMQEKTEELLAMMAGDPA